MSEAGSKPSLVATSTNDRSADNPVARCYSLPMFDGSTTGRAFESAAAPYVLGVLAVISIALWLWGRYELRRPDDKSKTEDKHDD